MMAKVLLRSPYLAAALLAAALLSAGCGASSSAVRPEMQLLDERRAVLLIEQAMEQNGVTPGPGKDTTMRDGQVLHVDVTVDGTVYGVAYVTEREAGRLGSSLPPRRRSDELRLIRPEGDVVLLLYQDRYEYDTADTHSATAIAAENELKKDIADFALRVVKADARR